MPTPPLPQKKIDDIIKWKSKGLSNVQVAKKVKVGTGTVSNVIHSQTVQDELLMRKLSMENRGFRSKYNDALKEIVKLQHELSLYVSSDDYIRCFDQINIKPKHGGKGEAVAIINACDWHLEEEVTKESVNGVNEYNEKIADRRIKQFWSSAASLVDMCRSRSKIDTIVVNVLGDLMSGWIHEPLMVTNNATPPEAALRAIDYLCSGLLFIKKEVKPKELIVVFSCGNHSRMTKKKFTKISPKTSYEWIVYNMVIRLLQAKKVKGIKFKLPPGEENYFRVYGKDIRTAHGDNIRYQGGVGGVHIPLRKAIDVWNTATPAFHNYFGHWHTDLKGEDYRMSGSLIGYSEYSIRIKARFQKPSQAFEIIHPKYGATAPFPIILD